MLRRPDSPPTADPYLPRRFLSPWDRRQLLHVRSWKLRLSADDRLLPEQMRTIYTQIGMLSRMKYHPRHFQYVITGLDPVISLPPAGARIDPRIMSGD